jgi:hypothetical protein
MDALKLETIVTANEILDLQCGHPEPPKKQWRIDRDAKILGVLKKREKPCVVKTLGYLAKHVQLN